MLKSVRTRIAESRVNPNVLVTYAWVRSSWAIIRNLARYGLHVHAGDHQKVFMSRYSRYCAGWFQYPHYRENPEAFIDSLSAYIKQHEIGTYLPSHQEGFVVAQFRDRLPATVRIPISDQATIERLDNQRKAFELAAELGIPYPRTFTFDSQEDFENTIEELPATGIIKEVISHGSHGVAIYKGKAQLRAQWSSLGSRRGPGDPLPVIQEYLDAKIYATTMLADRGHVIAHFVRRNMREKEPFGGACVKCESVHYPELIEYSGLMVRHLNYTGVIMIEYLVDEVTGAARLMDINPRYWGTTAHDIDAGIEYPILQFCIANGIGTIETPDYRDGFKSRWLVGDVISYLKARNARRAGTALGNRSLSNYLLLDDDSLMDFKLDDPVPFLVQAYLYFKFRRQIFQ